MRITLIKILLIVVLVPLLIFSFIAIHYYYRFSSLIDKKLTEGSWGAPSVIYAAPYTLYPGKKIKKEELLERVKRIGYKENPRLHDTRGAAFHVPSASTIEIYNEDSRFDHLRKVRLRFDKQGLREIRDLEKGQALDHFSLKPETISTVFGKNREKFQYIRFNEIPQPLVKAVLASEDKRFFKHSGVDLVSIVRALVADWFGSRNIIQGGSTITQQFVKNFFLTPERTWRRKIAEAYIALLLEKKYSKEKIFEFYSNKVYLGQHGSFSVVGFGEAAEAYFGKNLSHINLSEAALLAALIRAPNKYTPYKYPERAKQLRDMVLEAMQENGFITAKQKLEAKRQPLSIKSTGLFNYSEAPYFVDYVRDQLLREFPEEELVKRSYKIQTTLNVDLQKAAYEAVSTGVQQLDKIFRKRKTPYVNPVQACLIALDPRTGEILAMIGGRNYAETQYNRVTDADRQPGSSFKPFVYAAAINTAFTQPQTPVTTVSTVLDEPSTFLFEDKQYQPRNYKQEYYGLVTLRQAITRSLNVATIKFAERIGYDQVVKLAKDAGIGESIKPYPSMALGTFEVTPLEMARAYTAFANRGVLVEPIAIKRIIRDDEVISESTGVAKREVLPEETAYMITNLLQSVIDHGTGAGARARGFTLPAAGKTGTSHDGWFAGFTPDLLCIVWVGFDDNSELKLSGSQSALPIWTDFMKKAETILPLSKESFSPPPGIITVEVDPFTGLLASPKCATRQVEYFIKGTEPRTLCSGDENLVYTPRPGGPAEIIYQSRPEEFKDQKKKKGLFRRIFRF